jgi:DNA-binding IclR family transcriptional regulator
MTTALRSRPSAHARELILEAVAEHPYVQQRELASQLHDLTGLAESTLIALFQQLARSGQLEPGLDGRRRTYRLPLR